MAERRSPIRRFFAQARAKAPCRRPALRWQCQDAPLPGWIPVWQDAGTRPSVSVWRIRRMAPSPREGRAGGGSGRGGTRDSPGDGARPSPPAAEERENRHGRPRPFRESTLRPPPLNYFSVATDAQIRYIWRSYESTDGTPAAQAAVCLCRHRVARRGLSDFLAEPGADDALGHVFLRGVRGPGRGALRRAVPA